MFGNETKVGLTSSSLDLDVIEDQEDLKKIVQ